MVAVLAPGITVLNGKSINGQEFDTVFVMEFEKFLGKKDEVAKRSMYMLCSRARDALILMYEGMHLPQSLLAKLPGSDLLSRP